MQELKNKLKQLLPTQLLKALLPFYHLLRAIAANIIYGFPARGMHVIGVTGTNGKTTTAVLAASILEEAGFKVGLSTTALFKVAGKEWDNDLNMTTTDPFALQKLLRQMKKAGVDWVVMEATSHALRQHRLLGIPFHAVIWTNLTREHLDYHGTMDKYAAAKAKLIKKAKEVIVLNADDDWYEYFAKRGKAEKTTYGTGSNADVRLVRAKLSNRGSKLRVRFGDTETDIELNLPGKFNAYNALAAAACAFKLGVVPAMVVDGLAKIKTVPGRMEAIDEGQSFSVVVDFAHTADALEEVLETLKLVTKNRLMVVFGATGDRDRSKRPEMGQVVSLLADVLIVTDEDTYSEDPTQIRKEVLDGIEKHSSAKVLEIADRRSAIKKALALAKSGDTVVIAGMGHQKFRVTNEGKVEWDDRTVTRELLRQLQTRLTDKK